MICLNFMNFSGSIIGKNDDYKYSNNINTKFKKYFFVGFGLIINIIQLIMAKKTKIFI